MARSPTMALARYRRPYAVTGKQPCSLCSCAVFLENNGRLAAQRERHQDTLQSVNNLTVVLRAQGKYDETEQLHRRALEGSQKELK